MKTSVDLSRNDLLFLQDAVDDAVDTDRPVPLGVRLQRRLHKLTGEPLPPQKPRLCAVAAEKGGA